MNTGVRNLRRNVLISFALFLLFFTWLIAGIVVMVWTGRESAFTALGIALGIIGSLIFFLFTINFVWGMRVFGAIRRGENVVARWIVPAEEFDRFRANEAGQIAQGYANDYKVPRQTPHEGVEVIVAADGVIVGDTYFGLATTGMAHITQVGIVPGDPLCLGFETSVVTGRASSGGASFQTVHGLLRFPVANSAHGEARKALDHYMAALSGEVLVKPDFWRKRVRWGLWTALVSGIAAAIGFALEALDIDAGNLPVILAVSGIMIGLGGLVLAFLARGFSHQQRRGR
ncbi:MAG: hypothetical protein RJB62_1663 [Pseudomonadota bacterium]|jgi:hypothetical protein